jgi:hypothetical protein
MGFLPLNLKDSEKIPNFLFGGYLISKHLGYWGCNSPTITKNRLLILGTPDLIDVFPLASSGVDANPLYTAETREELI